MSQSNPANVNNRANQLNPNNPAYSSSRAGGQAPTVQSGGGTVPTAEPGKEGGGAERTAQVGEGKK